MQSSKEERMKYLYYKYNLFVKWLKYCINNVLEW